MLINRITPEQAKEMMQSPDCIVFDVRPQKKMYDSGHIKGAIFYPADTVDELTASTMIPDKDTPVILYCRSGANAERSAKKLMGYGYEKVYDLGALDNWPYEVVAD